MNKLLHLEEGIRPENMAVFEQELKTLPELQDRIQ